MSSEIYTTIQFYCDIFNFEIKDPEDHAIADRNKNKKQHKDEIQQKLTLNKTALCYKCNETVAVLSTTMSKHKSDHQEDSQYLDQCKIKSDLTKYGKKNYIHFNKRGCKGYCNICNIFLSAHMNVAKEHVDGSYHRGFLELKGLVQDQKHEKIPHRTVPFETFVDEKFGPFKIGDSTVVCINDGICVDLLSYRLMKVINDFKGLKSKCFACDITFNSEDVIHYRSKEHLNILNACKVVIIETDGCEEFIREIRPGLYHCGFCNKVFAFWENISKHLKTFSHKIHIEKHRLMSIICAELVFTSLWPTELMEVMEIEEE